MLCFSPCSPFPPLPERKEGHQERAGQGFLAAWVSQKALCLRSQSSVLSVSCWGSVHMEPGPIHSVSYAHWLLLLLMYHCPAVLTDTGSKEKTIENFKLMITVVHR